MLSVVSTIYSSGEFNCWSKALLMNFDRNYNKVSWKLYMLVHQIKHTKTNRKRCTKKRMLIKKLLIKVLKLRGYSSINNDNKYWFSNGERLMTPRTDKVRWPGLHISLWCHMYIKVHLPPRQTTRLNHSPHTTSYIYIYIHASIHTNPTIQKHITNLHLHI